LDLQSTPDQIVQRESEATKLRAMFRHSRKGDPSAYKTLQKQEGNHNLGPSIRLISLALTWVDRYRYRYVKYIRFGMQKSNTQWIPIGCVGFFAISPRLCIQNSDSIVLEAGFVGQLGTWLATSPVTSPWYGARHDKLLATQWQHEDKDNEFDKKLEPWQMKGVFTAVSTTAFANNLNSCKWSGMLGALLGCTN
jgi:hypothetical protein